MKQSQPQLYVSRKFLDGLLNRIVCSFPPEIADELIAIVECVVSGRNASELHNNAKEITRQIYKFMWPEIEKAVERSRRCREAAARRRAARAAAKANAFPPSPPLIAAHVVNHQPPMTRQMRRKLERQRSKCLPPGL